MKIINLETFLQYPNGTVYSKYQPCCFEGLMIKRDNCNKIDFFYSNLIGNIEDFNKFFDESKPPFTKDAIKLDFEIMGRDGMFEINQLFAIYEDHDIDNLIKALKGGFNHAYDE